MYLMNAPPVVATEWRACGPPGGYSTGLNDSDSDLSTRGTPIADKVQMIIESLRSTQSSVEMEAEPQRKALSGDEVCKTFADTKLVQKSQNIVNEHTTISDSDSDDSVDRGIEEAILEYLKEKDGPKQKSDIDPLQNPPVPGISKPNSEGNTFLTISSDLPKIVKLDKPMTPASYPIKKYIKHKASINESLAAAQEVTENPNKLELDQSTGPSKSLSELTNTKMVEDTDSSSDDGIEEAIQKYQMEKKDQQNKTLNLPQTLDDSDTSSDDGIEEAIRCYQLEQLREKSVVKPLLNIPKQSPKTLTKTNTEHIKKKKKKKLKKQVLSVCILDGPKGNGLLSAPTKANTTAELMCAEAILDISKTVMPTSFHQSPTSSSSSTESSVHSPEKKIESDGSSIDSEDGIEQEIKRFLEQKAQMLKKPLADTNEVDDKGEKGQNNGTKPGRLSLTKKRKRREALSHVKDALTDDTESLYSEASPKFESQKSEQSEGKSSSLDSDEDLDTAIKDLLKTKKKIKKKTRDLRRKPQDKLQGCAPLSKKIKQDLPKHLKKSQKNPDELKNISKLGKNIISQTKSNLNMDLKETETKFLLVSTQTEPTIQLKQEEDSSVDSDDSIELEIQKFLAEKAKVATAEQNKDTVSSTNGMCTPIQNQDLKPENQLAEIPKLNIPSSGQSTENTVEKLPFLSPQCLTLRNSDLSPAGSPSLLEPADGAGAARTDTRNPRNTESGNVLGVQMTQEEIQKVSSPNMTPSQSASIKWRQSLGLPITDTKIRTPFRVTSSKINEGGTRLFPSGFKVQNPASVWPFVRTTKSPLSSSSEMAVNTAFQSHALSFSSTGSRQHPGLAFTKRLAPSHPSQYPVEEETKSMVHISKDKSVYVELETNRTNHVQVRSRERSEERPDNSKMEDREVSNLKVKDESFIDEADTEAVNEGDPQTKQGLSMLSLSSAIDPGFTFKPCIALSTEERRETFYQRKTVSLRTVNLLKTVKQVKRKLHFVPVSTQGN